MPSQSPVSVLSVRPSRATPLTDGETVLDGASGAITGVKPLVESVTPPALTAVTRTRRVVPASDAPRS